ncbi:integrase family protein, partial [Pseudanabaenaceae cyanobacterium LEGE 13415]|nr:integrase family protein [Pseudanabaenaceae cyanobacterium LEGE 13415]
MVKRNSPIRITKRAVDAAAPASSRYELWDADVKGFGLRIEPSGVKSFIVRYRPGAGGRTAPKRFVSLGRYGALTPERARQKAKQILGAAANGEDPAGAKTAERAAATLTDMARAFLTEHVLKKRKAKTLEDYEHVIERYLLPEIGQRKALEITRNDLSRLHGKLSNKPAIANRVAAVASSMFSWGSEHGFVPEGFNPASKIKKYAEQSRERFLTLDEIARLGDAMREAESVGIPWEVDEQKPTAKHAPKAENRRTVFSPFPIAALRLLLLT